MSLFSQGRSEPDPNDKEYTFEGYHIDNEVDDFLIKFKWLGFWIFLVLTLCIIASCEKPAMAAEDPGYDLATIKAVIGEAESEGYQGMLAVSCAIRNRHSLQGVYGMNSKRVLRHLYSRRTAAMAVEAWADSDYPHNCYFVHGATNWENVHAFGNPDWANRMVKVYEFKRHVFYREANYGRDL